MKIYQDRRIKEVTCFACDLWGWNVLWCSPRI